MKKIMISLMLLLSVAFAQAQSAKYESAMKKNLGLLDSAKSGADYEAVAAAFERIGNAEKTLWLPFYYAAFAETLKGFTDPTGDKDAIGNKALELVEKAQELNKNAENYGVKYMAYIVQMMVNPMERYATFGAKAQQALTEGLLLDSTNARLYYLKGAGVLKTPTFAGGGPEKAKPILEKAMTFFNNEKPLPLYPNWGKKQAEQSLAECNK